MNPVKGTARLDESGGGTTERQTTHDEHEDKPGGKQPGSVEHDKKNSNHGKKSSNPDTAEQGQRRSKDPQVAIYDKNIHVVWEDNSTGNSEIYYTKSIDGGNSFGEPINLSNSINDSLNAKIKFWE